MKKFIEILYGYAPLVKTFHKEQNYYMQPIQVMKNLGYNCEILVLNADCKIEEDPNFIDGTKVIYVKNIFQFYSYLFKNRKHILYSNTLTIPTLSVGIIGKTTVFIPHSYIFGSNKIKKFIIKFFYYFFTKVRVNNDKELKEINKIKKNLGIKIPLVISKDFYNPHFKFSDENIFVSLGNLTEVKHPEKILEALKIVKNSGYGILLKVIGKDFLANKFGCSFTELVKQYGLVNNIEYLGYLKFSQIQKELQGCCCYLNASSQEGLCISMYESVLMGMMPILPNILSFDGIFGDNGLYYNLGDAQDFADKIMYFLDHRDDFVEKIKSNQQKILREYNYETIKQQLKNLFLSL